MESYIHFDNRELADSLFPAGRERRNRLFFLVIILCSTAASKRKIIEISDKMLKISKEKTSAFGYSKDKNSEGGSRDEQSNHLSYDFCRVYASVCLESIPHECGIPGNLTGIGGD